MPTRLSRLLLLSVTFAACAGRHAPIAVTPAATLATAPDHFAHLGQAMLRYREVGVGEPVILIHGYSASLEIWSALADSLGQDHHVVALDLRGFGQSTKFDTPNAFGTQMADDIIRLADNLRIRRSHIVGHSMGAVVAANVAARYPRRVASVTLIAGPFYHDSVTFAQETSRWVSELQAGRGITALLLWLLPGMDSASALAFNNDAMAHNDLGSLMAVLPSLGALVGPLDHAPALPALIAVGGNDPLSPYSHELASRWTSARLLEMPTANHMTVLSTPELLAALRAIAGSHTSAGGQPNQRLKLSARGGRSIGNGSVLIAAAAGRSLSAIR